MLFSLATLALASCFDPRTGDTAPHVARSTRPWTILVYGAADNSADGPIQYFLDGVRKALDDDPGVELLFFFDRSAKHEKTDVLIADEFTGTRLYRIKKDSVERLSGGEFLPTIAASGAAEHDVELDSADADTLKRFIDWGKATAPAQHYGVMIYSHASGESMCPDAESRHSMGIAEVSAKLGPKESVDFLALELCNMGGIEAAYEWRPGKDRFGAQILVAIPNAGPPLDWDRAFARLRSKDHASSAKQPFLDPATMTAAQFGALVIEEGKQGRIEAGQRGEPAEHEAAACYDLREAAAVKSELDRLSTLLWKAKLRDTVLDLRGPGSATPVMNYSEGGPYVDLHALGRAIERASKEAHPDVSAAASSMCAAVDRFVLASFGMGGYADFREGENGVFVVLPANKPGRWKSFKWYTPLAGEKKDYGRWSFLGDGATPGDGVVDNWFELLDAWYDESNDTGGSNGYRW